MNQGALLHKKNRLKAYLGQFETLLVAFSGGVDSTYLLAVAQAVLEDRLLAVTARSPVHPRRETERARTLAQRLNVEHLIVQARDMDNPLQLIWRVMLRDV